MASVPIPVSNVHIFTVGNTQYDLRDAVYWVYSVDGDGNESPTGAATVIVYFGGVFETKPVTLDASDWNTAKAASLIAEV